MTTQKERLLEILRTILREPTAPFHESHVREAITALLSSCPHVQVRSDPFGNLIAHYSNGSGHAAAVRRYALCAHMDHPGWVRPEEDGAPLRFLGGVPADYQAANRERIKSYGPFAMWDLPDCELREDRIYSRRVRRPDRLRDDCRRPRTGRAGRVRRGVLRTVHAGRGGGFRRGHRDGAFPGGWRKAGVTVISLETSAERPPAKMGDGPIVRVGDKTFHLRRRRHRRAGPPSRQRRGSPCSVV